MRISPSSAKDQNIVQVISLDDNVPPKGATTTKELRALSKQILSKKEKDPASNIMLQSLDFIRKRLGSNSKFISNDEGDQSFRKQIVSSFLEGNQSNISSVSTGASFSPPRSPQKRRESQIIVTKQGDEDGESDQQAQQISFIGVWNEFKQFYIQQDGSKQPNLECQLNDNCGDEEIQEKSTFNIFSCLQCFRPKKLPLCIQNEVFVILYIYNAKSHLNKSTSKSFQQLQSLYAKLRNRAYSLLQEDQIEIINEKIQEGNLKALTNMLIIAFADFHGDIFYCMIDHHKRAPLHNENPKMQLSEVANILTSEIIILLTSKKLHSQIVLQQSAINYINNLFFSLLFCFIQESVRNDNNFGVEESSTLIALLLKQTHQNPSSITNYFIKRLPSFQIDKNFLKYI